MGAGNRGIALETENAPSSEEKGSLELVVRKAMRGDGEALQTLCERIARRVLFLSERLLRSPADADDVAQDVLICVCGQIGKLRNPEAFWGWLSKIVANKARLHVRKNTGHGTVVNIDDYLEGLVEKDEMLLPQDYAENAEIRRSVMEVIDSLPPRQREAVMLHYYGGLSVKETADEMGIDHTGVSKQLAAAREKLKRALEKSPFADSRAYAVAALPLGRVMSDILERESAVFRPDAAARAQRILENCKGPVESLSAPKASFKTALKPFLRPAARIVSAAVVTTGLAAAVNFGGSPAQNAAQASPVTGGIVFSGGEDRGENVIYLNPAGASLQAESPNGEVTILEWYITAEDGETRLYSGEGDDPDNALLRLREDEGGGKYILNFLLEDEAGVSCRIYESFRVEP